MFMYSVAWSGPLHVQPKGAPEIVGLLLQLCVRRK